MRRRAQLILLTIATGAVAVLALAALHADREARLAEQALASVRYQATALRGKLRDRRKAGQALAFELDAASNRIARAEAELAAEHATHEPLRAQIEAMSAADVALRQQRDRLAQEVGEWRERADRHREDLDARDARIVELETAVRDARAASESADRRQRELTEAQEQLARERDAPGEARDAAEAERATPAAERDRLTAERDQVIAERDRLAAEIEQLRNTFASERQRLEAERDQARRELADQPPAQP
jgi:chromosome segregation ATPase